MELKKYKLGEILDVIRGASLSGEFYATEGEYIRLTCGNFDYQNNCFKENKSKDNLYYTGDFRSEFLMEKGDIITPLTEQAIGLLGSTAIIPESGKYIQSQDVAKIICKEDLLDKDFAFYLISSTLVKQQLSAAAQQTKIRHTSPDKIKDCTVWIPELAEQKRISKLLRSLDCKIGLNRAINQNLEAMAKQLYDYWFVQFDFPNEEGKPYKSSGGAMVWNEKLKREIPEGWNVMSINEICTSCRGVSYGKDDLLSNSNGVLVLRGNNIENNHIVYDSNVAFVPYDFVSEEQHIKEGDIIMTMSSGSKAHVGKCAMFHKDSEHTFGAFLSKFTPKKELRYMTFLFLTSEYFKSLITAFCNGTGINNLTNQTFDDVLLVLPDEKKTRLFESKVNGLFAMIGNNEENERILIKQRDELLPLLMNGQASVNSDLSAY